MSVCVLQQPVTQTDRTTGKQVQTCLLQPSALQIKGDFIGCNRQITRPMSVCVLQQPVTQTDRTTGKQVQTCLLQPSALQIKGDFPE